jgi:hypothetical protein
MGRGGPFALGFFAINTLPALVNAVEGWNVFVAN